MSAGIRVLLEKHFGGDPQDLSETVPSFERPNLQVALDACLAEAEHSAEVVRLAVMPGYGLGLAASANRRNPYGVTPEPGPVEHVTRAER